MRTILLGVCLMAGVSTLSATIIFTPEAAGVQSTTVANVTTVDFNSLIPGALGTYVSPIGTYSTGAEIVAPNAFGGSNQTRYISVGAQSGTTTYSLTFNSLQSFFGLYWAAGDAQNSLEFFNGATLLATFTTSQVNAGLSSAYNGNPNTGQDLTEKFVYLDFTSNALGTNFNRVVFLNNGTGTGFETDNHSILASAGVPEPSTYAFMLGGLGLIGLMVRRRNALR